MNRIACEMCGSTDLLKQDGVYVCQFCGTKHSVEEARKMMVEGPVTVVGTVTIDKSASYDGILELARDAYNDKRFDSAYDYYSQAVEIRPNVVENVLRQGLSILAKEPIKSDVPSSCTNRVMKAIDLIKQLPSSDEKRTAASTAIDDLNLACEESKKLLNEEIKDLELEIMGTRSALEILGDLGRPTLVASQNQAEDKKIQRHNQAVDAKINAVVTRKSKISDFESKCKEELLVWLDVNTQFIYWFKKQNGEKVTELYPQIALTSDEQKELLEERPFILYDAINDNNPEYVKVLIKMGCDVNKRHASYNYESPIFRVAAYAPEDDDEKQKHIEIAKLLLENGAKASARERNLKDRFLINSDTPEEIKRLLIEHNPDIQKNAVHNPDGGCYVATAVYGSYDCPQVWTLRRYRDYTLAETWYGRAFVHTYYAISPTLVKRFGHTEWFKKMWKGKLDRMVADLNADGVLNTPYEDRAW